MSPQFHVSCAHARLEVRDDLSHHHRVYSITVDDILIHYLSPSKSHLVPMAIPNRSRITDKSPYEPSCSSSPSSLPLPLPLLSLPITDKFQPQPSTPSTPSSPLLDCEQAPQVKALLCQSYQVPVIFPSSTPHTASLLLYFPSPPFLSLSRHWSEEDTMKQWLSKIEIRWQVWRTRLLLVSMRALS